MAETSFDAVAGSLNSNLQPFANNIIFSGTTSSTAIPISNYSKLYIVGSVLVSSVNYYKILHVVDLSLINLFKGNKIDLVACDNGSSSIWLRILLEFSSDGSSISNVAVTSAGWEPAYGRIYAV